MNRIHREGVEVGLVFSSLAKAKLRRGPEHGGTFVAPGEPVSPPLETAIDAEDQLTNATETQRPAPMSMTKRVVRMVVRLGYRLCRPVLRPLAFRLRVYFTEELRCEIRQKMQQTADEIQIARESSMREFKNVSDAMIQEVRSIRASIVQDMLNNNAVLDARAQRYLATIDDRVEKSCRNQKSICVANGVDVPDTIINDRIEKRFEKEREPSRNQESICVANGLIDVDSYLEFSVVGEREGWREFKNKHGENGWYFLFEKLFRGAEEEISKRQERYGEYIRECYEKVKDGNELGFFLDFGSGRGEFLDLMKKWAIPAKGVDVSPLNVEYVENKKLEVVCADGIGYLERIPDRSLFGTTMFQVAEHLEFNALKKFIKLSYEKILPGGMILIETVNPSCMRAMQYFYLDPSHVRPYPPELLKFQLEWEGFIGVKIIYYFPVFEVRPHGDETNYVGYAVVGHKPSVGEGSIKVK